MVTNDEAAKEMVDRINAMGRKLAQLGESMSVELAAGLASEDKDARGRAMNALRALQTLLEGLAISAKFVDMLPSMESGHDELTALLLAVKMRGSKEAAVA